MHNKLLSKQLYEETKVSHEQVENRAFIIRLKEQKLSQSDYVQHLVDLKNIYKALENGMRANINIPAINDLYDEKLCRTPYLEKDIESFHAMDIKPTKMALEYVRHLQDLSEHTPLLLLAHAYVRYMGDLSGGRMMKKYVEVSYPGDHQAFYDFDNLLGKNAVGAKFVEYKNLWKERLDTLELADKDKTALIQEAVKGFEFTGMMYDAYERN